MKVQRAHSNHPPNIARAAVSYSDSRGSGDETARRPTCMLQLASYIYTYVHVYVASSDMPPKAKKPRLTLVAGQRKLSFAPDLSNSSPTASPLPRDSSASHDSRPGCSSRCGVVASWRAFACY